MCYEHGVCCSAASRLAQDSLCSPPIWRGWRDTEALHIHKGAIPASIPDPDGSGILASEPGLPCAGQLSVAAADAVLVFIAAQTLVHWLFNLIGLLRQLAWG